MRKSWFAVVLLSLPLLTVACKGKKKALPPPVGAAPAAPTGAAPGAAGAPGAASVPAEPQPTPLAEGTMAPDFLLPAHDGTKVSLSGLRGGPVVLYFYPKDDTPGCTTEAQAFEAARDAFAKAGAAIVGVSKDTPRKHDRFKEKYGLGFTLASDEGGEMLERYGVWIEKTLYGRQYMGIDRATFLVGPDGVIRRIWRKVKVAGHAAEVLAAIGA